MCSVGCCHLYWAVHFGQSFNVLALAQAKHVGCCDSINAFCSERVTCASSFTGSLSFAIYSSLLMESCCCWQGHFPISLLLPVGAEVLTALLCHQTLACPLIQRRDAYSAPWHPTSDPEPCLTEQQQAVQSIVIQRAMCSSRRVVALLMWKVNLQPLLQWLELKPAPMSE